MNNTEIREPDKIPLCFTCGGSETVLVETGAFSCYPRPCPDCQQTDGNTSGVSADLIGDIFDEEEL